MRLHNRQIKAAFWTDTELIRELTVPERLLYIGLIQLADDSGCLEHDTMAFKIHLFPGDPSMTEEMISEGTKKLLRLGKLVAYSASGKECLFLRNFHKHQKLKNPSPPTVPLPDCIRWEPYGSNPHTGKYVISSDSEEPKKTLRDSKTDLRTSSATPVLGLSSNLNLEPITTTAAASVPGVVSTTEVGSGEPNRDGLAAAEADRKTSRSSSGRQTAEPSGHGQVLSHMAKRLRMLPTQISGKDLADLQEDCARHGPRAVIRAIDLACESQIEKGRHKRGDPKLGPDIRSYQFCREFLNEAKELVEGEEAIQRDREIGARRRAETQALIDELLAAGGG